MKIHNHDITQLMSSAHGQVVDSGIKTPDAGISLLHTPSISK